LVAWYDTAVLAVHLIGVSIWVGGSVALGVIVFALRSTDPADARTSALLTARVARGLAWVMWPALVATILTGLYNLTWFLPPGTPLTATPAGPWFIAKFAMVAVVVATAGAHTFVVAPSLRRARERGVLESSLTAAKGWSVRLAVLSTIASVVVVVLAVGAVGAGP